MDNILSLCPATLGSNPGLPKNFCEESFHVAKGYQIQCSLEHWTPEA